MDLKKFANESPSANENFLMETLVRQNKPVVTENYEFDYRDKSLV